MINLIQLFNQPGLLFDLFTLIRHCKEEKSLFLKSFRSSIATNNSEVTNPQNTVNAKVSEKSRSLSAQCLQVSPMSQNVPKIHRIGWGREVGGVTGW